MVSGKPHAAAPVFTPGRAHRRLVRLAAFLIASLALSLLALFGSVSVAHADEHEPTEEPTSESTEEPTEEPTEESTDEPEGEITAEPCGNIRDNGDDILSVIGRVCDRREQPQLAVVGVRVVITDSDGEVIAEGTTGAKGRFRADLPGDPLDHLGARYTATIDEDTLPEGTAPDVLERVVAFNLESDQSVTFPIGAAGPERTGMATQALQLAVGGLVFAVLLSMAALGLSMIFGTTGLTNFSHGELVTFGAVVAFAVDRLPGTIDLFGLNVTVVVAVIVTFLVSGVFGWVNDAALWRQLRRRGSGIVAMMIVSIGLSILLRSLYQYFIGASAHNYSQFSSVKPWKIGPVLLTPKALIVIVLGIAILVVVTSLLQYTRTGKAMRAVADNPALASATGINVERVISIVWIGGAALAGLSGALLGLTQGFDFQTGFKLLLLIFAAVILGGLGTIWGAIVGAFLIAMMTELSTLLVPAEFKFVGALLVLIVVLLFRPQGLLGRAERVG